MLGDPRDRVAYRIAIAAIGLAFVVLLAGVCTHVANGEKDLVPDQLWLMCGAAGGVLVGTLIPFTLPRSNDRLELSPELLLIVLVLAGGVVAAWVGQSTSVRMLGAALGGLLLGLLIPSPARWDR